MKDQNGRRMAGKWRRSQVEERMMKLIPHYSDFSRGARLPSVLHLLYYLVKINCLVILYSEINFEYYLVTGQMAIRYNE